MEQASVPLGPEELKKLVSICDKKGEGVLNYDDLLSDHKYINIVSVCNGLFHKIIGTKKVVQRGSNGNVLGGCSIAVRCVQRGVQWQ